MDVLTALFITTSAQFNLPAGLLSALCFVESHHRPHVVHYNDGGEDSMGICQIKLSTAQWLGFKGTAEELMEPKNNIYYAGAYLAYQHKRYRSVKRAVIAYNYGHAKGLTETRYQVKVYKHWAKGDK